MQLTANRTFESTTLDSLPVVAVDEGRVLGRVRDLVFDPAAHMLLGAIVARSGGHPDAFLDISYVRQLGPFAVTIFRSDELQPLNAAPRAFEVVQSGVRVRGAPVMTEIGEPIGRLDKVWLDSSGRVVKYRASTGGLGLGRRREILPTDVVVIGEDVIIVKTLARETEAPAGAATGSPADEAAG